MFPSKPPFSRTLAESKTLVTVLFPDADPAVGIAVARDSDVAGDSNDFRTAAAAKLALFHRAPERPWS